MRRNGDGAHGTRERLLEAAGEVFAQHGFRATTVREISRLAHANVAAVNYHFGDKEGLYSEVFKHALHSAEKKYPPDLGLGEEAPPEDRLQAFIKSILYRCLDEGRPAWHGKLMLREIVEPTAALSQVVDNTIRPLHARLRTIVHELLDRDADDEEVQLCAMSIVGQCVYYYHARPIFERVYGQTYGPNDIERLSDHITAFSLEAIKGLSVQHKNVRALCRHEREHEDLKTL
jgi:AcrR family transcriptional regulator